MNNAPFPYFGGKYRLLPNLTKYIPSNLDCYVEPFFGSGTLFFSSPRWAESEVINDLNGDIYNFFCVLRDQYPKLKRLLHFTPYDIRTFGQAKRILKEKKVGPVYRAWALYVLMNMSIMANRRNFSRASLDKSKPREFQRKLERLEYCTERLKDVTIENEEAVKVIKRYDSKNTFFYLDPPYLNVRSKRDMHDSYHKTVPSDEAHAELLEVIKGAKGYVLLSNYHNTLYDEILKDWPIEEVELQTIALSGNRGRYNKVLSSTEVLWSNEKCFSNMTRQPALFKI